MPELFAALNVMMVILLTVFLRKRGCRIFWLIQFVQMLEIPLLGMWPQWNEWNRLDTTINAPLELLAYLSTSMFPIARYAMLAHLILKVTEPIRFDAFYDFQIKHDWLFWVRVHLNEAIILILLAYSMRELMLRLRRQHVQTARSVQAPSAQAARA